MSAKPEIADQDIKAYMLSLGRNARAASRELARSPSEIGRAHV